MIVGSVFIAERKAATGIANVVPRITLQTPTVVAEYTQLVFAISADFVASANFPKSMIIVSAGGIVGATEIGFSFLQEKRRTDIKIIKNNFFMIICIRSL
jgi:hypothetical protein